NLGKEINTAGYDVAYRITTDGEYTFFASDRKGGKGSYDIYSIKLPEEAKPEKSVVTITGKVTDENSNPLEASLKWFDLSSNKNAGELKSDPLSGEYIITLPNGVSYSYFAEKSGYYSVSNSIDLSAENTYKELVVDIVLNSILSLEDKSVKLNNIYFDFDKFDLKSESYTELERVYKFLVDNSSVKVEISAYTDAQGSDEYNIQLSQKRAESVVNYLVSKGIESQRLIAKGYGESQPVASSDTEEGRAANRRVEMKIVK